VDFFIHLLLPIAKRCSEFIGKPCQGWCHILVRLIIDAGINVLAVLPYILSICYKLDIKIFSAFFYRENDASVALVLPTYSELQIHSGNARSYHQHIDTMMCFDRDFHTILRSTLQEDARQYLPFLRYLESSTGYRFKLRFTTKNSTIMEELGTNHVQFAAMGAMSYLKAKEKFNVTTIVQGINLQGQNKYRSFLVVKTDSSIKNLLYLYLFLVVENQVRLV
jgi:hypothetical protein